jgi:hypothetical protein
MSLKMPERKPGDGRVRVERLREMPAESHPELWPDIVISVVTNDVEERIVMSEHNAWRVFGMLSLVLGIPQSKAAGKAIKL